MSLRISLFIGFCLVLAVCLSNAERARFDNYRVYKVTADSESELTTLKNLDGTSDSLLFLEGAYKVGEAVKVVVAPHKVPDFLEILGFNEIEYELLEKNFQSVLETDDSQVAKGRAVYDWTAYHTLDDTYSWLTSLANANPGVVSLIEGGKSYQKRSILGVKISFKNRLSNKPGIFIEAGIHAREWIAPATATFIINELVNSNNAAIREVAQKYDWYIIPHANPDGYVYTHTTNRTWRKTRTPYGVCSGADPNRNWGFFWNTAGSSSQACSDTYAGPSEFSEIETLSLSNYLKSLKGKIQLYISFHSYSQYLLYPFGHAPELPENHDDIKQVFDVAVEAIKHRYGTKYTGGNIHDAIYPASGSSIDWAYANVDTKMAFCYELRPSANSVYTFLLPAAQIIPTGEETLDSIVAMTNEVQRLGYFDQVQLTKVQQ